MKYIVVLIIITIIYIYSSVTPNSVLDTVSTVVAKDYSAEWLTDYLDAKAKAELEGKPILINFTGSNWCAGCVMLNKEIFSKPVFINYAKEHLILLKIDFPLGVEQEESLINQNNFLYDHFEIEGLPTVILLNSDIEIYREYGYGEEDPFDYVGRLKSLLFN